MLAAAGVVLIAGASAPAQVLFSSRIKSTWSGTLPDGLGTRTPGYLPFVDASATPSIYQTASNTERSIAYNPATGNLLVSSRFNGQHIYVVDSQTGAVKNELNTAGIAGGTLNLSQVAVTTDGKIYVANLTAGASSGNPLKIYKFEDEASAYTNAATPATATLYANLSNTGTSSVLSARYGDSMKAYGSDANGFLVLGTRVINPSGFSLIRTGNTLPTPPTVSNYGPVAGTTLEDFGLGVGVIVNNGVTNVYTSKNVTGVNNGFPSLKTVSISASGASTFTSSGTNTLSSGSEYSINTKLMNGTPILASIDYISSEVRIWDISNPLSPIRLVSTNLQTGNTVSVNGNGNGTAAVEIAQEFPNSPVASIYFLNTNNGVQALDFAVAYSTAWKKDENGTWAATGSWTNAAPNFNVASATLGNVITAPRTVSLTASTVLRSLTFDSPFSYNVSSTSTGTITLQSNNGTDPVSLTVNQGSHQINATVFIQRDLNVNVAAGTSLRINRLDYTSSLSRTVTFTGSGTVQIPVMSLPRITLSNTSGVYDTFVDVLSGGGAFYNNTESEIRALVSSWWNNGAKNGKGLGSSVAATDPNLSVAVFRNDAGDGVTPYFITYAQNSDLAASTILGVMTYQGDVNLDGKVDGQDYKIANETLFLGSLAPNRTGWRWGDINYDGFITQADLNIIAAQELLNLPTLTGLPTLSDAVSQSIPEPTSIIPVALVGLMLKRRRSR